MAHQYLDNTDLDQALEGFLAECQTRGCSVGEEKLPVAQTAGRITSHPVYARLNSPHYNASAMDGIALPARLTFGASEVHPITLEAGQVVRLDTGDPVPKHCDCVVMIEDVVELGGGKISLSEPAVPWQHIRQIGEDVCVGDMILPHKSEITPAVMGAMLAGGVLEADVFRRVSVGVIPTGDEVVAPTDAPKIGDILEFNSAMFCAALQERGCEVEVHDVVPDDLERIAQAVDEMAQRCDMVLLNAGSSAGREDFAFSALQQVGQPFLHGLAIRPGKPTLLGWVRGKPFIGIPGYPVSAMIVIDKVVFPVVEAMRGGGGEKNVHFGKISAVLTRNVVSSLKYREFIRVKLGCIDGEIVATPLNRGAGVITSLARADGIWDMPQNAEGCEAGERIEVDLLRSESDIINTVCIIGSHDPMLDELSDIARTEDRFVSSSHVGSMGGVMAMLRGQAHAAGIHLLDETDGSYNISYFKRYFDADKHGLLRGVGRIQGLMVAPGNAKNISNAADLTRDGVRYVNRQKGSGTRILLDYLLKKESIASNGIDGYAREELTHSAVAAIVQSGDADAGLGIFSVAKAFSLDFVPIAQEHYDFIVSHRFMQGELGEAFLRWLRGDGLSKRLESMGGYTFEGIGERIL